MFLRLLIISAIMTLTAACASTEKAEADPKEKRNSLSRCELDARKGHMEPSHAKFLCGDVELHVWPVRCYNSMRQRRQGSMVSHGEALDYCMGVKDMKRVRCYETKLPRSGHKSAMKQCKKFSPFNP